jgi:DNA polymerase III subunit chi
MTERVDFYVLKTSTAKERWTFACRLTEKAYLRDLKVVLVSETADELLLTFNERSFVPHDILRDQPSFDASTPVRLTFDLDAVEAADLLVNLSGSLPARLERFSRIAEIIDSDDERRRLGRERFKAYRELKLPVETHQLDAAAGA